MKKEQNTNPFDLMRVNEGKIISRNTRYILKVKISTIDLRKSRAWIPKILPKQKHQPEMMSLTSEIEEGIGKDNLGSDLDVPGSELDDEQE